MSRQRLLASIVALACLLFAPTASAQLLISGVIDGPLVGGTPKAVELYAASDISDLSAYGIGSANNGGGSAGPEFTLSGSASAGQFLYVASEPFQFNAWFGFFPDFTTDAVVVNGDDAIELFRNSLVVDVFGEIAVDGTGQPWEYVDGWAYRASETGPDGSTFVLANWYFSGVNGLDNELTNQSAILPFPVGTFFVPEPSSEGGIACLAALGFVAFRRRARHEGVVGRLDAE